MENNSGQRGSVPAAVAPALGPTQQEPRDSLLPVTLWGGSLWLVLSGLPLLTTSRASMAELSTLAPLALGVLLVRRYGPSLLAQVALLAAYPAALGLGLALRPTSPDTSAHETLGPLGLLAASACLWAFFATATEALRSSTQAGSVRIEALPQAPAATSSAPPSRTQRLRTLVVGLFTLGALGIAVLAPTLGTHDAAHEVAPSWGKAAGEGHVLVAIVASSIACLLLSVWLAAVLRAPRPAIPPTPSRAVIHLSLALLGATVYYILRTS